MATLIITESPAVEQLTALAKLSESLSYEGGFLMDDLLVMAVQAVSSALARETLKAEADTDARKLGVLSYMYQRNADVASVLATVLRFAAVSHEYRTTEATPLDENQRESLGSCAAMAEIAAKLCREASGQ